jgi:TetR/AcrR family transcriptional repressor of nem operon
MSKGDETRQRIVQEAAGIFNRKGYEGSSLADLMEATGLRKGGIYRHFSGKEQLALEAFEYAWGAARDARLHDVDFNAGAIPQLKQVIANFVERRGPVPGGCPLLNTAIDSDDGNDALRERVRKAVSDWKKRMSGILRAGMKKDELRAGTDADAIATLIIASLEGGLMLARLDKNLTALRVVQAHLEQLLDSLAAD